MGSAALASAALLLSPDKATRIFPTRDHEVGKRRDG